MLYIFSSLLDGKEKLELRGKLLLGIQTIGEVDTPDAAVRMNLHAKRFDVVGACERSKNEWLVSTLKKGSTLSGEKVDNKMSLGHSVTHRKRGE